MQQNNSEVDVNVLISLYNNKLATALNQNILLEAKLETLSDILSLNLTGSFVLLGIFPLLVRKLLSIIETKKGSEKQGAG